MLYMLTCDLTLKNGFLQTLNPTLFGLDHADTRSNPPMNGALWKTTYSPLTTGERY